MSGEEWIRKTTLPSQSREPPSLLCHVSHARPPFLELTDPFPSPLATLQVQNLELLDSRAEQAQRSDSNDSNLWESERLQKADAAALRQQGGAGGGGSGGTPNGGAYQQQLSAEELEAKARKKAAEDKWWSAEPEAARGGAGGEGGATPSKSGESSWWEEEDGAGGGGGAASKGIDADSLPSFFDS